MASSGCEQGSIAFGPKSFEFSTKLVGRWNFSNLINSIAFAFVIGGFSSVHES
jgi:hypothetical protein